MKANAFGFYPLNGKSVVDFKDHSKKEDMCEFLQSIKENNPNREIILILDNFSSHHVAKTKETVSNLSIRLCLLTAILSRTRLENFDIVLLEAMACRTPVIASKIPGVMDLVTNENGLLVEPKSVEGLAEAIISIIHDENKVIKMGKRAEDWWMRNIIGMSLALKSSTCIGS
jgi:glycosyltransferase involved in cell wall biosynthesis